MGASITLGGAGIMSVVGGVGTIGVTVAIGATDPFTITATIIAISNNPMSCAVVNDAAANTISHTCLLPPNDACATATLLPINVPNCNNQSFIFTNATASTGYTSCSPANYNDVWFYFIANNTTVSICLGTFPGDFLTASLYANCGSSSPISCAFPVFENTSTSFSSLNIGDTYFVRLQISSPDPGDIYASAISAVNLPVLLLNFESNYEDNATITLTWETKIEQNLERIIIERSIDGLNYEQISQEKPLFPEGGIYKFIDKNLVASNIYYYRLNFQDYDGVSYYSDIINTASNHNNEDIKIYPNPANTAIQLILPESINNTTNCTIHIINASGAVVYKQDLTMEDKNNYSIDIHDLPLGMYSIHIYSAKTKMSTVWTKI
jgi:hypothetical protein